MNVHGPRIEFVRADPEYVSGGGAMNESVVYVITLEGKLCAFIR